MRELQPNCGVSLLLLWMDALRWAVTHRNKTRNASNLTGKRSKPLCLVSFPLCSRRTSRYSFGQQHNQPRVDHWSKTIPAVLLLHHLVNRLTIRQIIIFGALVSGYTIVRIVQLVYNFGPLTLECYSYCTITLAPLQTALLRSVTGYLTTVASLVRCTAPLLIDKDTFDLSIHDYLYIYYQLSQSL